MQRLPLLLALLTLAMMAWAQDKAQDRVGGITAERCLQAAPGSIFDLIEPTTRLDMIDYYDAGSPRHSTNVMGGDCYITAKSSHSIAMVGGNGIEYQLFVLNPADACPIIGVITTVSTPIPDSNIRFYDCRWDPLLRPILPAPTIDSWVLPSRKKSRSDIEEQLPFIMASYSYEPDTRRLTLTNNMGQYFVSSDRPAAAECLRDSIAYQWDGKKFKILK